MRIVLDCCPETRWVHGIHRCDLACAAVRDGTRALEGLFLVFAGLPRAAKADIEVKHEHLATTLGAVDEDVSWVTVHDVFFAIFQWLMSPIEESEMGRLEDEQFDVVIRAAEARRTGRGIDGRATADLNIDYLGEWRRFKGIRLAREDEVPDGGRLGEVFIVELE